MNMNRMTTSLLLILLGVAPFAWSGTDSGLSEYPEWARQGGRCHTLMTEAECQAFQQALGAPASAAEQKRLLAENQRLLREREASCRCTHGKMASARVPLQRQVMRSE